MENVRGVVCEHWSHSYANVRVHVYKDASNKCEFASCIAGSSARFLIVLFLFSDPIRLTEENFVGESPTMVLTYDFDNVQVGPQVRFLILSRHRMSAYFSRCD